MILTTFPELLQFAFISYGLTFMLKDALLFHRLRSFLMGTPPAEAEEGSEEPEDKRNRAQHFFTELFACSFCVGTWSGIFLALWALRAQEASEFGMRELSLIFSWALMSAVVGFVGDLLTRWLEQAVSFDG